jgi:3-deoxy-D-manno-octulosonate 8-phosphate phosphatase KdsC-like HAD superfamily phosphatase
VRSRAHWVSTLAAGSGAIRELAEFILDSRGELHSALARRLISAAAPERNDPQRGGR